MKYLFISLIREAYSLLANLFNAIEMKLFNKRCSLFLFANGLIEVKSITFDSVSTLKALSEVQMCESVSIIVVSI